MTDDDRHARDSALLFAGWLLLVIVVVGVGVLVRIAVRA